MEDRGASLAPLRNGDDLLREKFSLAFDVGGQVEGLNRFPRMQSTVLGPAHVDLEE